MTGFKLDEGPVAGHTESMLNSCPTSKKPQGCTLMTHTVPQSKKVLKHIIGEK